MNVRWILDPDVFLPYQEELRETITNLGHEYLLLSSVKAGYSWDDEGCSYRALFPADRCTLFHGCIEIARRVHDERLGAPGVYGTFANYYCSAYFPHFGDLLFNHQYTMLPLGDLERCRDWIFEQFGVNEQVFVRPDSPSKPFAGQLVSAGSFDSDLEILQFYDVPPNELIVVSRPKTIQEEWRFVVVDGDVIAGSQYREYSEDVRKPGCPSDVNDFALRIANTGYQPDPAWVFDVCRSDDRLALLEIGCFSHSDLYGCDKAAVVDSVSRQALRGFENRSNNET